MKQCGVCFETKPLSSFYKNKNAKDGHQNLCAECSLARTKSNQKAALSNCKIAISLLSAKARAKRLGLPFTIKPSDIKQPKRCPIFGMVLNYGGMGRGYGAKPDAASLDRIYPEKGYVPGNVVVISWKANRAKSMLTPSELSKMAAFYASVDNSACMPNKV